MDNVENQQITETIPVYGLLSDANIGTWQADYPLTALDFEHIKKGKSLTFNWANSLLLTTIGFGLNLLAKGASQIAGIDQKIYIGEWIALALGFVLTLILYLIGLRLPNDRKKVMNNIEEHFNKSPKKRQVVKGDK
ncbi:MAG: hypothetical protein HOO90_11035 [Methylotenera sp.]|uniref:hypothetical protein n=1 Tax=Methylotenera sp. TaxID=2051956 RepID=UPI0017B05BAF|nr:hypothetical protein [Methylotenera sp.]NOU26054.1 hypothetical protein [Methylotenera sp.]